MIQYRCEINKLELKNYRRYKMTLNGFKFEFRVLPDIKGDSERLIILEIKNNKYFLEYKKRK